MENEIQQSTPPVQPLPQTPTTIPIPSPIPSIQTEASSYASPSNQPLLNPSQPIQPPQNQQPDVNVSISKAKKVTIVIVVLLLIVIISIIFGVFYLRNKSPTPKLTVGDGLTIAQSINPQLPEGYTIAYKAKLVKLPGGGILFDTQLINGDSKIGITIVPGNNIDCSVALQKMENKSVCAISSSTSKSIRWTDGKVVYEVLSGSPKVAIDDITLIVNSL